MTEPLSRGGRDKGVLIPAIVKNQGDRSEHYYLHRGVTHVLYYSINKRDWTPSKNSRVCSEHFVSGKFEHSF